MSTNVIAGELGLFLPQTELGCRNWDTVGCFPALKRLLLLWAFLAVTCCFPSCSKTSVQPRGELSFYFLSFTEGLFWAGRRAGQPGGTTADEELHLFSDQQGESLFSPCFGFMQFSLVKKKDA